MNDCDRIEEELPAYLEGLTSAVERRRIEEHLSLCDSCSRSLKELERTRDLVRSLPEVEPPPWLASRIMAHLEEESQKEKDIFRRLFYPFRVKIPLEVLATCMAAVLVFYVYKSMGPELRPQGEPQTTFSRESPLEHPERDQAKAGVVTPGQASSEAKGGLRRQEPLPPAESKEQPAAGGASQPSTKGMAGEEKAVASPSPAPSMPPPSVKMEMAPPQAPAPAVAREAAKKDTQAYKEGIGAALPEDFVSLRLRTRDSEAASESVEKELSRLDARKITKEPYGQGEIMTAEMTAENLNALVRALKAIGNLEGPAGSDKLSGRRIRIRIEIVANP